jgi:hypothetical protein
VDPGSVVVDNGQVCVIKMWNYVTVKMMLFREEIYLMA